MHNASHAVTGSNILWTSILVSAAVAAFATLIIEYPAKPQLEVRKERILERSRRKRAALNGLRRADYRIRQFLGLRDQQSIGVVRDRTIQIASAVVQSIEDIQEEIVAPGSLNGDWTNTTAAITSFLIKIQISVPARYIWDELDTAGDHFGHYADLFSTSHRHWWRRRRLVRKIKSSALPRPTMSTGT